jgi:hypothetical protein
MGVLVISPWMPEIGLDKIGLIAAICAIAAAISVATYLLLMSLGLRAHYLPGVDTINVGLVVNAEGMHYIAGQIVIDKPWSEMKSIKRKGGVIMMTHTDGRRIVPDYVFHSAEDSNAFVGLALALKKGKAAPDYDWSAYKAEVPVVEGVWPPPAA